MYIGPERIYPGKILFRSRSKFFSSRCIHSFPRDVFFSSRHVYVCICALPDPLPAPGVKPTLPCPALPTLPRCE